MSHLYKNSSSSPARVARARESARRATLRFPRAAPLQDELRKGKRRQLIGQDLFADVLTRELKRADRFEEAFALLLISLGDRSTEATRREVAEAVTAARWDTDIVGWFEQDRVIGLIRPLAHVERAEAAAALAATVQRELLRAIRPEGPATCSIRLEVYSAQAQAAARPSRTSWQKTNAAAREVSKRALDVAGSLSLLCLLSPVFLAVCGLIKLTSKGPVLFRQVRVGQENRPFTMFKFRTMHVNADPAIHQQYVTQFIQSGGRTEGAADKVFKIVDDPRVTPLGHFLRRASLDELPQFLNVLRGEMSLVGPRPPLPYEVERYKAWHLRRLSEAKPGITGLWQVTGRSRTTFDEMVRLDLQYAKSHSFWTDIKILLATPRAMVSGNGAH
jgi:lipopolysaccharide/colanic/teichoic acid biosynthesis glycosyltransferase